MISSKMPRLQIFPLEDTLDDLEDEGPKFNSKNTIREIQSILDSIQGKDIKLMNENEYLQLSNYCKILYEKMNHIIEV